MLNKDKNKLRKDWFDCNNIKLMKCLLNKKRGMPNLMKWNRNGGLGTCINKNNMMNY